MSVASRRLECEIDYVRLVWEIGVNVALGLSFVVMFLDAFDDFSTYGRISALLLALAAVFNVFFCMVLRLPKALSIDPFDYGVAIAGTFFFTLLRAKSVVGADMIFADILQIIGGVIHVVSIASLNRSFGIVAANRGIRTRGVYRFIRHPMYLGYIIGVAGFVLNHLTMQNLLLYPLLVLLMILRIRSEERLLTEDALYKGYAGRVRWRLIPYLY